MKSFDVNYDICETLNIKCVMYIFSMRNKFLKYFLFPEEKSNSSKKF